MPSDPQTIIRILQKIRIGHAKSEAEICEAISLALLQNGYAFEQEAWMDKEKSSRVDFLVDGCIVVEVKKGKPNSRQLAAQIERYAKFRPAAIILVVEGSAFDFPEEIDGTPVFYVALHKMFGIAI